MDGPSAELVCSIIILIVFFYCVSRRHLLLGQVCQLGRNWQFPLVQGNTAVAAAAAPAAKNGDTGGTVPAQYAAGASQAAI